MSTKRYLLILLQFLLFIKIVFGQSFKPDSTSTGRTKIGYDKLQHAAVSCLLTLSGQYILEDKTEISEDDALYYSASSAATIGLAKELSDMKKLSQPFDWGDMLANFIGIGFAVLIISN